MRKWVRGAFLVGLIGVAREDILLHDDLQLKQPKYYDQIKLDLERYPDPYLNDARALCYGEVPSTWDCFKYELLERFEGFLSSDHRLGDHALLVKSSRNIDRSQAEGRSLPGIAGYLARRAWEFAAATDLVLEFPTEITGGDVMAPRFIDEVFSEFDTIDNKHEKPQIRNQLKKLFIPLLIILKIFKLKLLFLLPLILGVASFKKLIGFLAILIPGVIGYLKLCRSGTDYGAHGHSSYYNRPPHRRQDHEYSTTGEGYEPYSPEFADIHPDYLPDYLQEKSSSNKYLKASSHTSKPQYYKRHQNHQYQKGTFQSSGNPQSQTGTFQSSSNSQYQSGTFQSSSNPQYQSGTSTSSSNPQYQSGTSQSSSNPQYQSGTYQSSSNPQYQSETFQSSGNPQYQTGTYQSSAIQNSQQEFQPNPNLQTHRDEFWKAQPDYLPYKGYYSQQTVKAR